MLCVTSVYVRETTNTEFSTFALDCESSERLLFLLKFGMIATALQRFQLFVVGLTVLAYLKVTGCRKR